MGNKARYVGTHCYLWLGVHVSESCSSLCFVGSEVMEDLNRPPVVRKSLHLTCLVEDDFADVEIV